MEVYLKQSHFLQCACFHIVAREIATNEEGSKACASSKEAQKQLLEAVGMIDCVEIPTTQVIEEEDAGLLSCALSHFCVKEPELFDPCIKNAFK